jgi:hypothetical protein
MKTLKSLLLILVATIAASAALAADAERPVSIPFVSWGGIKDWRSEGTDALLIEGRNNKWYEATFFSPCIGMTFSPLAVGFVTEPGGSIDKFSSILVEGQRCWFRTLQEVPPPQ